MSARRTGYVPALRFHWLTPLYDPLLRWGMREDGFKRYLVEQMAGRLPALLAQSGFADVQTVRRFTTVFGPLASLKGLNP